MYIFQIRSEVFFYQVYVAHTYLIIEYKESFCGEIFDIIYILQD